MTQERVRSVAPGCQRRLARVLPSYCGRKRILPNGDTEWLCPRQLTH